MTVNEKNKTRSNVQTERDHDTELQVEQKKKRGGETQGGVRMDGGLARRDINVFRAADLKPKNCRRVWVRPTSGDKRSGWGCGVVEEFSANACGDKSERRRGECNAGFRLQEWRKGSNAKLKRIWRGATGSEKVGHTKIVVRPLSSNQGRY